MTERRLAHYRLLQPIGQGGMGVVYEATDTRLARCVAVKLLPASLADDPLAVARFLREGRAAAALCHPRVCAVYDLGESEGQPFIVMERLHGTTLRRALAGGPLPLQRTLEVAAQVAEALEAAHAAGIVHRDVKPSNVFLTRDGSAKLTDFGLARRVERRDGDGDPEAATGSGWAGPLTRAGAAVGTVGYMSPEQARGEVVDARSDLFSLGAVVYEMATGRPPFTGPTDAVTFEAILGQSPPPPRALNPSIPGELESILEKALEKERSLRYQTAADLRVDLLRAARSVSGPARPAAAENATSGRPIGRRRWLRPLAAGAALLAALALVAWASRRLSQHAPPQFTQLTFRRGIVHSARFTRDGHTVVYSALWDGGAPAIFSRRLDSPASAPLDLPPATLLSLSAAGELAILLAPPGEHGVVWLGTLARVPLTGGPVRRLLDGVLDADWSPDGRELAVVRWLDGRFQLEYPIGTLRLRPCPPTRVRVSPDGATLALLDDDDGILLIDRAGRTRRLRVARCRQRLAWLPDGRSLLVDAGDSDLHRTLRRVTTSGDVQEICALAGTLVVHDVSRDGRVLLHHGFERWDVRAREPGKTEEREASAFANSSVVGLSSSGAQVLLWYHGDGPPGAALLQPTRGGPPLRLGEGRAHGLSADARYVLLETGEPARFSLTPTGAGEPQLLPSAPFQGFVSAWRVDEHAVGFDAAAPGGQPRSFLLSPPSGSVTTLTREGMRVVPGTLPDGGLLARGDDGSLFALPATGGPGHALPFRLPSDPFFEAVRVSGDGRRLFVRDGSVPAHLSVVDLATGRRSPWLELGPRGTTGVGHVWSIQLTPDGSGYAYTHGLFLQDLYLVQGLP